VQTSIPSAADKRKREAAKLHDLGPIVLSYFLAELANGADFSETLDRYLKLSPEIVRSVGADSADATATAAAAALAYVPPRGNA
jgi:hypothetical protein